VGQVKLKSRAGHQTEVMPKSVSNHNEDNVQ